MDGPLVTEITFFPLRSPKHLSVCVCLWVREKVCVCVCVCVCVREYEREGESSHSAYVARHFCQYNRIIRGTAEVRPTVSVYTAFLIKLNQFMFITIITNHFPAREWLKNRLLKGHTKRMFVS